MGQAVTKLSLSNHQVVVRLSLSIVKFYYPDDKEFQYVRLAVDRMEQVEGELNKIESVSL